MKLIALQNDFKEVSAKLTLAKKNLDLSLGNDKANENAKQEYEITQRKFITIKEELSVAHGNFTNAELKYNEATKEFDQAYSKFNNFVAKANQIQQQLNCLKKDYDREQNKCIGTSDS